jgi:subtilisin family serine protease
MTLRSSTCLVVLSAAVAVAGAASTRLHAQAGTVSPHLAAVSVSHSDLVARIKPVRHAVKLRHARKLRHAVKLHYAVKLRRAVKQIHHATAPARRPADVAPVNDPLWSASWGLRAAGAPAAWQFGQGSPRVVVAVLDTGVDATQPDLAGALVPGWNTMTDTSDTSDTFGHGTAVAGVIAARSNNGVGGSGYCSLCSVMPVKVLDGVGGGSSATVAAGITWAEAHGANVINMSLILGAQDSAVSAAVADAIAHGIVVVASAGNDSGTSPNYPADDPNVIGVAGTDPSGNLYPWSNHGDWVTVSAPGCNEAPSLGGGFGEFCGTSSAAAAASGMVGLALADSASSGAQILAAVHDTSLDGTPRRLDGNALVQSVATRFLFR